MLTIWNLTFSDEGDEPFSYEEAQVRLVPEGANHKHTEWEYISRDDYILMQCTGLKDSEGKLIYEGDIMDTREECGTVHVVEFMLMEHGAGLSIDCSGMLGIKATKIIGNIYENDIKEIINDSKRIYKEW